MLKIFVVTVAVALLSTTAMAAKGDHGVTVIKDDTGPGGFIFGVCRGPNC